MGMRSWKCCTCEHIEIYFDYEKAICPNCEDSDMERMISVPLSSKSCDKVDRYHNVDMERGIDEDLKSRNKKHNIDTIDDFIDKFGAKHAKEIGLLVTDDNGKTWRKKEIWDERSTIGKHNKGSASKNYK